jgi:hypothetical protein
MNETKLDRRLYTELLGEKPFDWFKTLRYKIDNNIHDYDAALTSRAASWTTCACGNTCDIIPRFLDAPSDPDLKMLGHRFYSLIADSNWESAICVLERIEKRSIEILDDIAAGRPVAVEKYNSSGMVIEGWKVVD